MSNSTYRATAGAFGSRWASRFTFNQFVTNLSLIVLWFVVLGLAFGVGRDSVSATAAGWFMELAWAAVGSHILLALHLDKAIFVFWSMAAELRADDGGDESGARS